MEIFMRRLKYDESFVNEVEWRRRGFMIIKSFFHFRDFN